jgi:hypothetical protein
MDDARVPEPATTPCARCGAPFHCGAHDSVPCWCSSLKLDRERLAELSRRYTGCLCGRCLSTLARTSDTS